MKRSILAIALTTAMFSAPAIAQSDQTIMFELGIGFGQSGRIVKSEEELANPFNNKFCFHRPSSRMVYGAIRYRYERAEAHVARWFNDSDQERCDRDSWAAGLGYVLDTQDIDGKSVDDVYATYTPGIAYTWGDNVDFNVQDNTNTNWRLKDNWQMYNRVAIGGGDEDYMGEIAVVRYGNIMSDDYERSGENFVTITLGARDFDSEKENNDSDKGLTPPVDDGGLTIIINNDIPESELLTDPTLEGTSNTDNTRTGR